MKGTAPFQGEMMAIKTVKIHRKLKKNIYLLQNQEAKFNQLSTSNYPWVKGIQVYSNKGPGPLQKGGLLQKCQNGVGSFKNFLLKYCWPISDIVQNQFC
jgi:hypothetical protein